MPGPCSTQNPVKLFSPKTGRFPRLTTNSFFGKIPYNFATLTGTSPLALLRSSIGILFPLGNSAPHTDCAAQYHLFQLLLRIWQANIYLKILHWYNNKQNSFYIRLLTSPKLSFLFFIDNYFSSVFCFKNSKQRFFFDDLSILIIIDNNCFFNPSGMVFQWLCLVFLTVNFDCSKMFDNYKKKV